MAGILKNGRFRYSSNLVFERNFARLLREKLAVNFLQNIGKMGMRKRDIFFDLNIFLSSLPPLFFRMEI